jgi:hypothetical protein
MPTTKDFNETVKARIQESAEFRRGMLREALSCMMQDDIETGKNLLRDYINATSGFVSLGRSLGRSPKTLMQMLGPKGNPGIRNFFDIIAHLQAVEGATFEVVDRAA